MKSYLIKMRVNVPYPKEFSDTVEATEFHVAIARALKYTLKPGLGKKRFDEVHIHAIRLKGMPKYGQGNQSQQ